jgi:hypothetical protein
MISVSLLLQQPRAAAAVLTPEVECVALKELRALRARILASNRLLDAPGRISASRLSPPRSHRSQWHNDNSPAQYHHDHFTRATTAEQAAA